MDENERPPEETESSDRVITVRLTRDVLILIAALLFLGFAVLLALLFPPGGSQPEATATVVAVAPSATEPQTPTIVARETTAPEAPTDANAVIPTIDPQAPGSYPAPGDAQTPVPTSIDSASALATETAGQINAVPTFAPVTPTPPGAAPQENPQQATAFAAATSLALGTPLPSFATGPAPQETVPPTLEPSIEATAVVVPATVIPQVSAATPEPPVQQPQPTAAQPAQPAQPAATARPRPTAVPKPTVVLADILRGNLRWTIDRSPIVLTREQRLPRGSSLVIDPGVEVRLAPGVQFYVEGALAAYGQPGQPVRFVGLGGQRWDGIYGLAGSNIILENTELRGGGNGGTLLATDGGALTIRRTRVTDNGGQVRATGRQVEVRDSEIAGNDMPYGSAIDITLPAGGSVTLTGNRIGGNNLAPGTAPVSINSPSSQNSTALDLQGNLLIGESGPDLIIFTNGPLTGGMTCNSLLSGTQGLSLKTAVPQIPLAGLHIRDNVINDHTPPIIPIYLKYGIGRGATSDLGLDMRGNWWGSELGPYQPELYADGRGDAVGANIAFQPWLTDRPGCAPKP